ncbi:hypothetical protein GCM10018785_59340 [Streptomyces longispororuber]|uniref:Uncharacterized protein n=1 Tax=Streptomyces longispororuber TaxID=68230 RepID=A0A919DVV8_9ACTN|nr:hypothetical protein [Streptomyces longispororuber]GHE83514.1 hypothetical protein GCM10018785_59340 [Streptomyces longispororuber]
MALQLRMLGTTSDDGKCPTLYEDMATGDIVVQGYTVTDPEDLAQVQNVLEGESFVRVPRALLTRFSPEE